MSRNQYTIEAAQRGCQIIEASQELRDTSGEIIPAINDAVADIRAYCASLGLDFLYLDFDWPIRNHDDYGG